MRQQYRVMMALLSAVGVLAGPSLAAEWNLNNNGNWNVNGNWVNPATYPNAVDAVADMSLLDITANRTVNVEAAVTNGSLSIGDASGSSSYTLGVGTAGNLTFDVSSGNATLTDSSDARDYIDAPVTLNDTLVITASGSSQLEFRGTISGTGGLTKSGTGYLSLRTTVNNYTGTTTINGGAVLYFSNNIGPGNLVLNGGVFEDYWSGTLSRALGTGAGQVQIPGGASGFSGQGSNGLTVRFNNNASTEVVWGTATFNPSPLVLQVPTANSNGKLTFENLVDLNGATRTIAVNKDNESAGGYALMSGVIRDATGGSAGLVKSGVGLLRLSAANTFTGGVSIAQGAVRVENTDGLGTDGPLTFAGSGARCDLRVSPTVSALSSTASGYGTIFSGSGARTLTVDQETDTTYSGVLEDGSGTIALVKAGNGRLDLNGSNTFTGAISVNDGTLGGTGSVAGAVSVASGAILAPGASPGTFTVASNVTIASGGTLSIEIDDTQTPKNSTLAVSETLDITDATVSFDVTGTPAQFAYHIATYDTLVGTFNTFSGMPAGYTIDYAYGGNVIAIKEAGGETQPIVTNSVTDVGIGTATLRGELTDGTTADAYVCWGSSDAGTNSGTSAWQRVESLGWINENAPFSTNVTPLYYGNVYNYRLYVTNTIGDAWSGLKAFTTLPLVGSVAAEISYHPITGDDDCEITNTTTYTHAVDFGNDAPRALINGVQFQTCNSSTFGSIAGTAATIGTGTTSIQQGHGGDSGATPYLNGGASCDMEDLVEDMNYNDSTGVVTIDGLTPGQNYRFRLYNRQWGTSAGSNREQDFGFDTDGVGSDINGAEDTGHFEADDASQPDPSFANWYQVYALTYDYVLSPGVTTLTVYINATEGGTYHMYGLTNEELPAPPTLGISATAATNVAATTADLVGSLDSTGTVFTVRAYWGTNNHADAAAWLADGTASNMVVGTYSNVTAHSVTGSVASLAGGTVYYFTMVASNALTNIWASANVIFGTDGPPTLVNDGYTPENGYATLSGNVISVGGIPVSVRVYWGSTDGGTTAANWANTNIFSGTQGTGAFSTNTTGGLIFGQPYYFRCSASNANGVAWAPVTTTFFTGYPSPVPPTANLEAWYDAGVGVEVNGSGTVTNWTDRSGNARHLVLDAGTPTVAADQVNGLPAINFDNDGESLKLTSPQNEYFSKETWLAFRSGQANTFRGWGAPFGSANGDDADRSWMFQGNTAQYWTSEPPEAVNHNGTAIASQGNTFNMASQGSMSDFMVLRVVTGPNSGTHVRPYVVGTRNDQWAAGRYYTAELLAYNSTNSTADQAAIGGYLANKYGITTIYPTMVSIADLDFSAVTATSATFNASFKGEASLFDVYVYWGTTDGGDDAAAWGKTNFVGSYTNQATATNVSFSTNGLAGATRYYYRFRAQNGATNIWADPVVTFQTLGQPTVGLGAGAVLLPGYATLNGSVVDGGEADVTVCWGLSDAGTNAVTDWDNTIAMGTQYTGIDFSSNTTGALYGPTYYYRVYGTNAFGDDWSAVTNFTTLREKIGTDGIMHYGYHTGPNGVMNLNNNGGMMGGGDPTQGATYYGSALVTSGPGGRGLDFNDDGDFAADGAVGQTDNYSTLFLGYLNAPSTGSYTLRSNGDDDRSGIWLDLDRNGVFESFSEGLTSDDNEQLAWEDASAKTVSLTAGKRYRVAFTHSEGGGGSRCEFRIIAPGVSDRVVKPADGVQAGLWTYDIAPPLNFTLVNNSVSNVTPGKAWLNATLTAPSQIYDVRVFWATTDYGTNKADWISNGDSALVGSYTNPSSLALTYQATGLLATTNYYYAFQVSNALEEIWSDPAESFETFGGPTVVNTGVTSANFDGMATLNGNLTAGGFADVYVCWGLADEGTGDTSAWANVVLLAGETTLAPFSTRATGLLYGVPYYYTCFATNAAGGDWSSVTNFLVGKGSYEANGLRMYGYDVSNDSVALDLDSNGGMLGGGDPTSFQNFYGTSILTSGPGDRGLDFNGDSDFSNAGLVSQSDNYSVLFTGYFQPPTSGAWELRNEQNDDVCGFWLDLDQDGVFESTVPGLGSSRGEQLMYESTSWFSNELIGGEYYRIAFVFREGGGGAGVDYNVRGPGVSERTVKPTDALQNGMWHYGTELNVGVTNTGATGIVPVQADLNGTFFGEASVYDVWVYWSTNNGATSKSAWLADGDSQFMGNFTNVASTALVHTATELLSLTAYYYSYYASNAAEEVWGDASLFVSSLAEPGSIFLFK